MAKSPSIPSPSRPTETARLELARLACDAPLNQVLQRACELSAQALGVERVGVWLFIKDRSALRCANLYERSKNEHSSGTVLRVADYPSYFASLTIRKAVPAEIAGTEPWTAELAATYLQPLGITSMLDAGIFVDSTLVGVVCHENVGPPREWTTEARDFAGSIADLLALRLQSAKVQELRATFNTQQERIVEQAKTEALAQLAAGVAHDFRNLLTVVLGEGDLLSKRTDVPADVRAQGRTISFAAERGITLASELMAFARPVERTPVVRDLAELTAEFLPVLKAAVGSQHQLRYSSPSNIGQVLIDKSQYNRLLLNLVINACESMPDGGPVEIRLSPVKLVGEPSHSGRFVALEVIDHGVGMDEATRQRVFEPYYTTKSKGTGLGLPIVRQVAERAGGIVRIDSEPGNGTTIRVFFPRIGAASGATSEFVVPPELKSP